VPATVTASVATNEVAGLLKVNETVFNRFASVPSTTTPWLIAVVPKLLREALVLMAAAAATSKGSLMIDCIDAAP